MKCSVCEGTSFAVEDGIKSCNICGMEVETFMVCESQDVTFSQLDKSQLVRLKKRRGDDSIRADMEVEDEEEKLSNLETFNIILHEWTNALVSLGASPQFREMVLQLWTLFLQRAGLAFCQDGDSQDIVDYKSLEKPTVVKRLYCYFASDTDTEKSGVPKVMDLKNLNVQKPEIIGSYSSLLSLIHLALVLAEEPILTMDLIRWIREGHVPYLSINSLLPKGSKMGKLHKPHMPPFFNTLKEKTVAMAMFLNILHFPIPSYKNVMDRVIQILRLPKIVGDLALHHMKNLPRFKKDIPAVGIEVYAVAAVMVVLKAYWGLNDDCEVHLSRTISRVNRFLKKEETKYSTFFCWEDWQRYMNKLIWFCGEIDPLSEMHFRQLDIPTAGNVKNFSNFLWTEGIWRTGCEYRIAVEEDLDNFSKGLTEKILDSQDTSLDALLNQKRDFSPTNVPFHGIVEQFLNNHLYEDHPLIKMAEDLHLTDFSNRSFSLPSVKKLEKELSRLNAPFKISDSVEFRSKSVEDSEVLFMPNPLKCLVKIPPLSVDRDYKRIFKYPSKSMKWLVLMCCMIFEFRNFDVLDAVVKFEQLYP